LNETTPVVDLLFLIWTKPQPWLTSFFQFEANHNRGRPLFFDLKQKCESAWILPDDAVPITFLKPAK
jgi:hypothetical protein